MYNEQEKSIMKVIVEKYPVQLDSIRKITNEMYQLTGDQHEYFARITNYRSFEEQLEEIKLLSYLSAHGVGVPSVVPSKGGKMVEKAEFPTEQYIVLFRKANGIHLPRSRWDCDVFLELGREIGKLHRFTSAYECHNKVDYLIDWHESEEYSFLKYIPEEETTIREISRKILSEIHQIPKNRDNYGLLHGDIWLENVLVTDSSDITIIDFQDCEKHFYIYDLVVPIYSALEFSYAGNGNIKEYGQSIAKSMFKGYLEENRLPVEMIEKLPLFFKLKELFEYNLMHMYWNMESLAEEQVRILNHYRIRLESNYPVISLDPRDLMNLDGVK
ncbi:protein kinase [Paenibacillus selenitireducens]|uniref:Protein kinase n=1 Tax=Paenibacillus selenitireducens TaxID=1324314 RepID=A0A1T2X6K2_9BACL|nr:phosphotransferase [Paenibacillus selenitireducens]OPA75223.1 protein kinase [Paenibacillus selenitireducens]